MFTQIFIADSMFILMQTHKDLILFEDPIFIVGISHWVQVNIIGNISLQWNTLYKKPQIA